MISTTIEKAINQQINQELAASYTYLAMSAWFDRLHLDGFAAFMLRQSQDEQQHAHPSRSRTRWTPPNSACPSTPPARSRRTRSSDAFDD